jgi:DNA processing protein
LDDQKKYWVGFNLVKGIGSARMRSLLNAFGSAENAWKAPVEALENAGLSPHLAENVTRLRSSDTVERAWDEIQKKDIRVLTWEEADYPRRLKEIEQPPPVLYLRGQIVEADQWAVAIVGTRRITAYGRQVSEEIAQQLAQNGVSVVSGLARGVDSVAHTAALKNNGRTLAVLGNGVDQIYPPEHRKLTEEIIQHGALISDYPPGTVPEAANFPPRNRIISGLALAVIIVEAGEKSGALITAAFGTNSLIHQGAHIFLDVQDVLEILNLTQVDQFRSARTALPADATESQLFSLLGREALHVDEIRLQTNLPIEQVTSTLTLMELKGLVRQVGSMRYIAIYEQAADYTIESN